MSTLKKFGFEAERVLRAHAMQGPNQFSDVHVLGCLDKEVHLGSSRLSTSPPLT